MLGLGRGGRHKVLPAITLTIAYLPALASVAFSVILGDIAVEDLISYGDYMFIIGTALALFAALIAPEALGPDRRSGMLGLYLAGPLDRNRYLLAKWLGVFAVMLLITVGPLLFMLARVRARGLRAVRGRRAQAAAADSGRRRHHRAALHLAVAGRLELHGPAGRRGRRHRAAAVRAGRVVRSAIESADAPNELDLISSPFVAFDLAYRIFDEEPDDGEPVSELSTLVVVGGLGATIFLGAFVCWLRYRRLESFR